MEIKEINDLDLACSHFDECNTVYRGLEAEYKSAKKLYEIKFMGIKSEMEGKNESERDRKASITQENIELVKRLNEIRSDLAKARAEREGAEANLERMRQKVSLTKELISKGIYT